MGKFDKNIRSYILRRDMTRQIGFTATRRGCCLPALYIVGPLFLVFFAIPYLFDLAYCEELYGTPLSQASLSDGEQVEPFGEESSSRSLDPVTAKAGPDPARPTGSVSTLLFQACNPRSGLPIVPVSRPPPTV